MVIGINFLYTSKRNPLHVIHLQLSDTSHNMGKIGKNSKKRPRFQHGNNLRTNFLQSIKTQDIVQQDVYRQYVRVPKDIVEKANVDYPLSSLRPGPETEEASLLQSLTLQSMTHGQIRGNRLLNMSCLADFMTGIYREHKEQSPSCDPAFYFPQNEERTRGLGTSIKVRCNFCVYVSDRRNMFENASGQTNTRGFPAAKVNLQLANFLGKSPMSISDIRLLFASLDSICGSETGLQKLVTRYSSIWKEMNDKKMTDNINIVRDLKSANPSSPVTALTDTVYNNAPKGRGMYQPGTQSFSPLLHAETGLLLAVSTRNKLCSRNELSCSLNHECKADMKPETPMGNSEMSSLRDNVESVAGKGLKLDNIVSDGVNALPEDLPVKLDCIIHRSRAQGRKMNSITFSEDLVGKTTSTGHSYAKAKLVHAIVRRCSMELFSAVKKYGTGNKLFNVMRNIRGNIIECFRGDHSQCKKNSLVCNGRNPKYSHLPYCKPINATMDDVVKLQSVIDFKLNDNSISKQTHLFSTNRVENLHLRTLKILPKAKTSKLNYEAKNHSAMINHGIGTATSLALANKALGSTNEDQKALKVLSSLQKREQYFTKYKRQTQFKSRRNYKKLCNINMKKFSKLTSLAPPPRVEKIDHDAYASKRSY